MEKTLENYLSYLRYIKLKSENTIKGYEIDISQFFLYLKLYEEIEEFKSITKYSLKSFMVYLNKNGISKRSINRKFSALKNFFIYLVEQKIVEENLENWIVMPKYSKKLPIVLNVSEVKKIINIIDIKTLNGLRDRCIIEVLYSSGLRAAELLSLQEDSIDLSEREIKIIGKGNKERYTFCSKIAIEFLKHYINEKKIKLLNYSKDLLFVNNKGNVISDRTLRRICKKYAILANIEKDISPHSFRHSFATHLMDSGLDIRYIQELLGHSSITTTEVYTHVSKNLLKREYFKTHPFANK